MRRIRLNKGQGFSLLEIVISAFLLSVMIMAIFQLFPSVMLLSRNSLAKNQALNFTSSILEHLQSCDPNTLDRYVSDPLEIPFQDFTIDNQNYRCITRVTQAPGGATDLFHVVVEVEWDVKGQTHSVVTESNVFSSF